MTCLTALLMFMSSKAGMPNHKQGWVIHNENTLFYTWYQQEKKNDDGTADVDYLAAALSSKDLQNTNLKPIGQCTELGETYTLFRAKGKI